MASGNSDGSVGFPPRQEFQRRQAGFGYLLVLFAVAVIGLSLASAGEIIHTQSVREKEAQLLFIGQQFRYALAAYRDRTPIGAPSAPASLDDLLRDPRFPQPVHHLRRLWLDPMTNRSDWVLLNADGRVVGVHSRSSGTPLRSAFSQADVAFTGLSGYNQWVFVADPPRRAVNP